MKTTKKTVITKKLEKLAKDKKISKSSLVYGWVLNLNSNDILRPVFVQGSTFKHSSLVDKTIELQKMLNELQIEYKTGNDAPRGGKTGFFVRITTKIS